MSARLSAIILAVGVTAGLAGGYWYGRPSTPAPTSMSASQSAAAAERTILYYRDPSGAPYWSATPKTDAKGRDYPPVYEDEEVSFDPSKKKQPAAASGPRKILYYRNPMGLPDTSPVPRKDWMGMDYIAVYEGEEQDDGTTVKVSLDKLQRSGVRTEPVERRVIVQPVRAVGTLKIDERGLTIVAMRSEGYIEDLFVNTTGQAVRKGDPLFRVYSSQIQQAQIDLMVAMRAPLAGGRSDSERSLDGAMQRLRNLGIPESRIQEVRQTGGNPRTIDWPAPASGTVIEKRVVKGQRVMAGEELYRIADLSHVWVIADVAEGDLGAIKLGTQAAITVHAYPAEPIEGTVTFIYPELKPETRTARVRIEVPNPDGRLKPDMYANVVITAGAGEAPAIAIPDSALIDSGARQVALVAKGDGRFEPRAIKLGRRGDGYVEVLEGLSAGEEVVTSATFLIDAESNLKAALRAFSQPEAPK
jgi:membrane fusion protein, copper/silver efflux system